MEAPGSKDATTAWVAIARVETTHGRRGELSAEPLTDFPERFAPGLQVRVRAAGRDRELCLQSARFHKRRVLLKFQGVDSIAEAAALRGALIEIPRSERAPLPAGRVYVSDLMGCSVVEGGEVIGRVTGWEETGGVPLLQIDGDGREVLIPFTPAICYAVDVANRRILVRTPEGLRELNRPKDSSRDEPRFHRPRSQGGSARSGKKRRTSSHAD
jgi:16S rRNA processing protein RimM